MYYAKLITHFFTLKLLQGLQGDVKLKGSAQGLGEFAIRIENSKFLAACTLNTADQVELKTHTMRGSLRVLTSRTLEIGSTARSTSAHL